MSILTEVLHGKLSFSDAAAKIEADAVALVNHLPAPLHDAINAILPDLKQAASNAVDMGDTAMKAALDVGLTAITPAISAALAHYVPAGTVLTPMAIDALDRMVAAFKAEIDALAFEAKAAMVAAPAAA
jgi:hypothetical protein